MEGAAREADRPKRPVAASGGSERARSAPTLRRVASRRRIDHCPCESGIDRFACPCCGLVTLLVTSGIAEYEICKVCFCQHDHVDEAYPERLPLLGGLI